MAVLTETSHAGEFFISKGNSLISCATVTIAAGQTLSAGAVLGRAWLGDVTVTAGDNTGNGVIGPITLTGGAMPGDYILTVTHEQGAAGDYQVISPKGYMIGAGSVGDPFDSGGLAFTLADGSNDFVRGDSLTIHIEQDTSYVEFDPSGVDGRDKAAAILFDAVDASSGARTGVAIVRDAEINGNEIIWKNGVSDDDKAAAKKVLERNGIIIR